MKKPSGPLTYTEARGSDGGAGVILAVVLAGILAGVVLS